MKHAIFLALAACVLATAAPSLAQTAPGAPPASSNTQQFQHINAQMQQIRAEERSQIIQALTPANKTLLGNIVAKLATSTNPDVSGAVNQLDAALSSSEKQAIFSAAQSAGTKERALIQSMRRQFAPGTRDGGPGQGGVPRGPRTDAAIVLLRRVMPDLGFGSSAAGLRCTNPNLLQASGAMLVECDSHQR